MDFTEKLLSQNLKERSFYDNRKCLKTSLVHPIYLQTSERQKPSQTPAPVSGFVQELPLQAANITFTWGFPLMSVFSSPETS